MECQKLSCLENLPQNTLWRIIEFLPVSDALNCRLSCRLFYKITRCKQFYQQIQIKVLSLSGKDILVFRSLMEKYGAEVRLSIQYLSHFNFLKVESYVALVQEMTISLCFIHLISSNCKYLRKLKIFFSTDFQKKSVLSVDFACLGKLKKLDQIIFQGYFLFPKNILKNIFTKLRNIRSIEFQDLSFGVSEYRNVGNLQILMKESSHIESWTFANINCVKRVFTLPKLARFLKCSEVLFDVIDIDNSFLQTLVLDSVTWINKEETRHLENLVTLKLRYSQFSTNSFKCKNLQNLEISECNYTSSFIINFVTDFGSSLKKLTLQSLYGVGDESLAEILQSCKSLTYLSLIKMERITPAYVTTIRKKYNLKLFLKV